MGSNKQLRVLMQNRINAFAIPGGDTVQMLKTREYLQKLGVAVDISLELEPDLRGYDLVHLFNLVRIHETYIQAQNARKQKKPLVLSTVYWNFDEYEKQGARGLAKLANACLPKGIRERLKAGYRYFFLQERNKAARTAVLKGARRQQLEVLDMADMLLPNAWVEMEQIERDFRIAGKKFVVVPNAVDPDFFAAEPGSFHQKYGIRDFVLAVGRFDSRKNFLNLIKALDGTELPLVIIGYPTPGHSQYFREILRAAGEKVFFLDQMNHRELKSAYAAARVLAQPSWLETPGLTALEGGAAGCNLVVSDRGSTREYFGDYAWYCQPGDLDSIRQAVLEAYHSPPKKDLKELIRSRFTWNKSARITLSAYERL